MSKADEAIQHSIDTGHLKADCENGIVYNKRNRPAPIKADGDGYAVVSAKHPDGGFFPVRQHRVIAYAFYGEAALEADVIDHEDRNKRNNKASNLVPKTFSQNAYNRPEREKIVSNSEAIVIAAKYLNGATVQDLAYEYNISLAVVSQVVRKQGGYSSYTGYEPVNKRPRRQDIEFWKDVDAGKPHSYLTKKYGLTFSAVAHRIERRKV